MKQLEFNLINFRKMNILHLVEDEKFIDFFAMTMSLVDGSNHKYIVRTSNPDKPLRHIIHCNPFRKVDDSYFSSGTMHGDLADCDVLVVHFLTKQGVKIINQAPKRVKVVWSGWGADYYHLLPGGVDSLLGSETLKISREINFQRAGFNPLLHMRLGLRSLEFLKNFSSNKIALMQAIRRINYFSSPIPEDYALLKNALGSKICAEYVQLNYGSLEATFNVGDDDEIEKRNILVGNSSNFSNNHVEVFRLLSKHDLSGRKVIVPLSYGDFDYQKIIINKGCEILGSKFEAVTEFMPLIEYNKIISTCSYAIMNQYRQQALGNICSVLYSGAKLFMNKKNITSNFLKTGDVCFFDVDVLAKNCDNTFVSLTCEQKLKNKQFIKSFWGEDAVLKNAYKFIDKMKI